MGIDGSTESEATGYVASIAGDRRVPVVGLVDVGLLVTLVLIGVREHGTNPFAEPVTALTTAVPFVVAWVPIAALAGVYRTETLTTPTRAARVTAIGWLAAANVGLILRSSGLFDGGSTWPFNLVLTGLGLLVLVGWRVAVASVLEAR
ncbi:DUF3054 domain-containing protein [Halobacteria archaeon AArc-m2/3/4]|uniref:DUF3054 domain-containing protein n=1 Tax=Natronoglomus mannanivorans TaxID=2979990 RepID=A0AAP2YY03_9EURY|nr:DUF3054 domain-containing protein [Halobacteria archaeon AArc-xg1-1]MCU4973291.1 DUF3054 domain-containing protein [Halobacteria archaeon AArc-m2/3/4]